MCFIYIFYSILEKQTMQAKEDQKTPGTGVEKLLVRERGIHPGIERGIRPERKPGIRRLGTERETSLATPRGIDIGTEVAETRGTEGGIVLVIGTEPGIEGGRGHERDRGIDHVTVRVRECVNTRGIGTHTRGIGTGNVYIVLKLYFF